MRVDETIGIERAPEDVWAFIADPVNDARWCKKVESVKAMADGRWRVTHKPIPLRPPMALTLQHVELDPPRRLRLREEDEVSVFDVEYRLEPVKGGTSFTQVSEFTWKSLPRPLQKVFALGVRRDIRHQLRQLKKLLEAQ